MSKSRTDSMVFVIDDERPIRDGLTRLFRAAKLASESFASAFEFLSREQYPGPSCLVLDIRMPGMDGLELQRELAGSGAQIIFLSGNADVPTCAEAMKAGAVDFLLKPVDADLLLAAVHHGLQKSADLRNVQEVRSAARERLARLTTREFEVMQWVVGGNLNKQIAAQLGAAEKTIKIHRGRVMDKMSARSLAELVRLADAAGVEPLASAL